MRGDCFICNRQADDAFVVGRFDGSTYDVSMCAVCLADLKLGSPPIRQAHKLIDLRNDYRATSVHRCESSDADRAVRATCRCCRSSALARAHRPAELAPVRAHEIPDDGGNAEHDQNQGQLLHASPHPVSEATTLTDQPRGSNRTRETAATSSRTPHASLPIQHTDQAWSRSMHPRHTPQVASEARPPRSAYAGAAFDGLFRDVRHVAEAEKARCRSRLSPGSFCSGTSFIGSRSRLKKRWPIRT